MRTVKTFMKLAGVVVLVLGLSNCKKDKDSDSCLTCSYDGETAKICESDKDAWGDYFDSWAEFVEMAKESGICD